MHALRVQADDTALAAAHLAAAVPEGRAAANSAAMTVTTCMWVWCRVWARRSNAVASAREPPRAHSAAGCSTYQGHQGDRVHGSGAHCGGGRDLCRSAYFGSRCCGRWLQGWGEDETRLFAERNSILRAGLHAFAP